MVDEAASFETAIDRDKWRGLVEAAKGLKGPLSKKKKKISSYINFICVYTVLRNI
jgi:hypothetical protein